MTTFNTRNRLGSNSPKDLYDNAENLDNGINGPAKTWTDRLGVTRKSWNGIETDFQQFLADGSTIEFPTWAAASAAAGAGQIPQNRQVTVIGDPGEHVDPVSGQIVPNSGRYVMAASGLEWRSADVLDQKLDKADIGDLSTLVRSTEAYADISSDYAWGKVTEDGRMLPGTLQGLDGLPADENVSAYQAKGVAVYALDSQDIPAGHSVVKDGKVLLGWSNNGHISYLPPLSTSALQSISPCPRLVPTPLPPAVRTAVEPLAERACVFMLASYIPTWVPLAGGSGIPSSGTNMDDIEQYPMMLAAVTHWIAWCDAGYRSWDAVRMGVSYSDAVAWVVQGLDLVVSAHLANGGWWGGPMPPWTDNTSDVALTFASAAAELARNVANQADLMASHMSQATVEKVKAMVVYEANRFVGYAPKYRWTLPNVNGQVVDNYPLGDSKSEELAWNLGILARALVVDPGNANAERWAERMVAMQIAALGDRRDLAEAMQLNGLAPRDTLRGTNVNPTRLVENHGVADGLDISRWYTIAALSGSEWMLRTFHTANQPVPAVALWHMADTYQALSYLPDGQLWSMDWRGAEMSYAMIAVYMYAFPNPDYIELFVHRCAVFAAQQDPVTGALPPGANRWPIYGSSQPGEFLNYLMLSDRFANPLTAPHSTNAPCNHLCATYRSK